MHYDIIIRWMMMIIDGLDQNDDGFDSRMGLSGDHRMNDVGRTRNRCTAIDERME